MATYYVSKSADNGYAVGADTNNGTAKGTPFLTLNKLASVLVDGDVAIVNGGALGNPQTYTESAKWNMGTPHSVTIYPDANGDVPTWRNANQAADGWIVQTPGNSKTFTLGAIGSPNLVLDAQNVASSRAAMTNATSGGITYLGVQFLNWTTAGVDAEATLGAFLMQGCTVNGAPAGSSASLILSPAAASDTVTVRSCIFNAGSVAANNFACVSLIGAAAGATVTLEKNTFTVNLTFSLTATAVLVAAGLTVTVTLRGNSFNGTLSGTNNVWRGYAEVATGPVTLTARANTYAVSAVDANTVTCLLSVSSGIVDVERETMTVTANGTLTSASLLNGLRRDLATTGTSPLTLVKGCRVTLPSGPTGSANQGTALWLGSIAVASAPAGAGSLLNVLVNGNTVSGGSHGISLGWIGGAEVRANLVAQSGTCSLVNAYDQTTPNQLFANLLDNRQNGVGQGTFLAAASAGGQFYNNLVLRDATTQTIPVYVVLGEPAAPSASVLVLFANNLVYYETGTPTALVLVKDTSTAQFRTNGYYAKGGTPGPAPFTYQGVNYTPAAWFAQIEPDGYNLAVDPLENEAQGDYRVLPSSPLYRGGTFVSNRATDRRGRPFWSPPSVGAYEATSRDLVSSRQ